MIDPRLTLPGTLARAYQAVEFDVARALRRHDLTHSMFYALCALRETPDGRLRMGELADQVRLTRSGVTRLVDRLFERGLVEREGSSDDRRMLWSVLTPHGRHSLSAALPDYLAVIDRRLTAALQAEQLEHLMTGLAGLSTGEAGARRGL